MNDENTQDRNEQADDWAAALAGEDDAGPSSAQPSFGRADPLKKAWALCASVAHPLRCSH